MTKNSFYILILLLPSILTAQTERQKILEGSISYISSQNVYVKFNSTEGIEFGDILFLRSNNDYLPAVKVEHKSSTSCAGIHLTDKNLNINTILYAFIKIEQDDRSEKKQVLYPEQAVHEEGVFRGCSTNCQANGCPWGMG